VNFMTTIRVIGQVDDGHRLTAMVPDGVPAGRVEVVVVVPGRPVEDADSQWLEGVAREWHADLADVRQDIYDLADGKPADEAG
jgi:hypothetical protein